MNKNNLQINALDNDDDDDDGDEWYLLSYKIWDGLNFIRCVFDFNFNFYILVFSCKFYISNYYEKNNFCYN